MLLLSRADVEGLLQIGEVIDAVEQGFRLLSAGEVVLPQRIATPVMPQDGLHLTMPVYVAGEPGTLAVKIVTVYRSNEARHALPAIQGVVLLHDAATGQIVALMDAEALTAARTGAASGVATRILARPEARSLLLLGAGALAPWQAEAVCAVRPIERITVVSRSGVKDDALCAHIRSRLGIDVQSTRDLRPAVEQADIICTATSSVIPLFDGAWLRPGTHINAMGAYTRTMRELDETALRRARVFVDRYEAAESEAGDIVMAAQPGAARTLIAAEIGEVLLGRAPGRQAPEDITLFKSVGLAVQDAVTAQPLYAAAIARGAGLRVDWGAP